MTINKLIQKNPKTSMPFSIQKVTPEQIVRVITNSQLLYFIDHDYVLCSSFVIAPKYKYRQHKRILNNP